MFSKSISLENNTSKEDTYSGAGVRYLRDYIKYVYATECYAMSEKQKRQIYMYNFEFTTPPVSIKIESNSGGSN